MLRKADKDCDDGLPCTTDKCNTDTHTCLSANTCDATAQYCTASGCVACLTDAQCQGGGVVTTQIIRPIGCPVSSCVKGACQTTYNDCGDFQICCQPYGCQLKCGIQTQ